MVRDSLDFLDLMLVEAGKFKETDLGRKAADNVNNIMNIINMEEVPEYKVLSTEVIDELPTIGDITLEDGLVYDPNWICEDEQCELPSENTSYECNDCEADTETKTKQLANAIGEALKFEFSGMILVKPLEKDMVYKTLTVPEDSGEKDEDGETLMQMTIKQVEVESSLRRGIILSLPASLDATEGKAGNLKLSVGDTIVYLEKRAVDFDLFKDSALVAAYEVIAKLK